MNPTQNEKQVSKSAFTLTLICTFVLCFAVIFCSNKLAETASESSKRQVLETARLIAERDLIMAKRGIFEYNPLTTTFYNTAGKIAKPSKVWVDMVAATTANGQVIDISSAGFTNIVGVQVTAETNTGAVLSMPFAMVKSHTTTQIVINSLVSNSVGVLIGGTIVGLTAPTTLTGTTYNVLVYGN